MNDPETIPALEGIAIIGMAGRFPGAKNVEAFWQNLRNGVESISRFSDEELQAAGVDAALLRHPSYVKAGVVLDDVEMFDAAFFGYTPREAELMDPQHRLFLECAWEALEKSGYDAERCRGPIGVFAGASMNSYLLFNLIPSGVIESARSLQAVLGNNADFLTTRVSYKLNLKGPSFDVQTSCSTSLVAAHLACQSLLNGECDLALAGGVSISVPQRTGYLYQEQGIYSPDGHCRAFDAQAQGTAGGRGAGVVVLKRLADAVADGDFIFAVIKGSAINNDGADKIGFTAPSVAGQTQVIAEALAVAGVDPETVGYIETHGTGTPLGDPIEIEALTQAFRAATNKAGFCAIGAVKTNIGHLDAAAGVTGLIKTALALHHRELPPSLNYSQPNPKIDFSRSPFYVNTKLAEWKNGPMPRRAGVSSFGMGGTNAHLVLEEAPLQKSASTSRPQQLLLLSAKTADALENAAANLAAHLQKFPPLDLADAAFTLQIGRKTFAHRRMLVCRDLADAVEALQAADSKRVVTQFYDEKTPAVAFMFPGQGAQFVNMGAELYQTEPKFREQMDRCAELLQPHLNLNLREIIYPKAIGAETAADQLRQTCLTQPALFTVEYALAQLWMSWGIQPQAMIGHSIGEYVAACLAGVMTLEEALTLVARRGRLMQDLPGGAMLSVPLPAAEIEALLDGRLALAAVNEPQSCVVSGCFEAVDEFEARISQKVAGCRRLQTSHAFHSAMMDGILDEFTATVRRIQLEPPRVPYVSNLTGSWITEKDATDPNYYARHLRQTVRFAAGVQTLLQEPNRVLLEVGPGRTLSTLAERQRDKRGTQTVVASMRHPNDQQSDVAFILNALGRLWLAGSEVNWDGFYAHEQRRRLPLPTYPFERERYWIEPSTESRPQQAGKKTDIADWFYIPSWKRSAPSPVAEDLSQAPASRFVIFADNCGLSASLVQQLESMGLDVLIVKAGDRFVQLDEREYAVNPASAADYDKLVEALATPEPRLRILHLWGVEPLEDLATETARLEKANALGFYSLLYLTQALVKRHPAQEAQMIVMTSGVYDVIGSEPLSPEKATVLGACKVIPQEYPNFACRHIDLDSRDWGAREIIAELLAKSPEPVVAYRGPHRWVQAFAPVRYEARPPKLREGGVYLIIGGVGGIGFEAAIYLAKTARVKLVLTGRAELPAADASSPKNLKLRELEAAGAEVLYCRADIADETQMRAVISAAEKRFGAIHGVIHAAGAEKNAIIIQQLTRPECEQQFQPKLQGLVVLEKILQGRTLDFCVMQSSLSAVLGALGFAAYTAAHLFMDAFTQKHNRTAPGRWQSVNWDNWLNWKEPESALAGNETDFYMTSQEGAEAFGRVLANGASTQLVVSTGDLEARLKRWVRGTTAPSNGKSKTPASASRHRRPQLRNDFAAPNNNVEQTLAEIWADALGIEKVGRHDNFFELGGDSVLIIQIIARAGQAGLRLTANQVFEKPTIAELAPAVSQTQTPVTPQSLATGAAPLTPIQHWFFEQNFSAAHHFNLPMLLELQPGVEAAAFERAIQHVVQHHDALRLRYRNGQQFYAAAPLNVPVTHLDFSALAPAEQNLAMQTQFAELHASLNLSAGPLVRVALCNLGKQAPKRALIVVHHLLIDLVSWRMVMEDLQTALRQLGEGRAIQLPPKTTSFQRWSEQLGEYARSEKLPAECDYWLGPAWEKISALPVDAAGENLQGAARSVSVALGAADTLALLQEVPKTFNTQINDALLAALAQTFAAWTGQKNLLIHLEAHGREEIIAGVDISRTVGWFTSLFPVLLALEESAAEGEALLSIKEQLRRIPNRGIGYGLLRYLRGDEASAQKLRALPQPEVGFLYMGQFDQAAPEASPLRIIQAESGPACSPLARRSHLLDVFGLVMDGRLQMEWMYSEEIYRRATIENLARGFIEALQSLIRHCRAAEAKRFTPSDFPGARISQKDLDTLLHKLSFK